MEKIKISEFKIPDFLLNHSTNDVHRKMKSILPVDLDVSEGSHTWNLTRPTALVVAELCEFVLPEVIKLIFPEWSYGEFLDGHAKVRGMTRREARAATGTLLIEGKPTTIIPEGSVFSTASINEEPTVDYMTTEEVTIPESGTVEVGIRCTQTGIVGNTTPNTIIFVGNKITGVSSVTNPEEVSGGTEIENDSTLIERIVEYDLTQGESFNGNPQDYKRWAQSVPGVGNAIIIPAQDASGLVTIIITDLNGAPATEALCQEVYNYIMVPDDPGMRKAPINAILSVLPPDTIDIAVRATVELKEGHDIDTVKEDFVSLLSAYLPIAMEEEELKYSRVWAELSDTTGVNDFSDLEIGIKSNGTYGTRNIPVEITQLPMVSIEDITFTEGSVS